MSFPSAKSTKTPEGNQERFIREIKWMAARLGIEPNDRILVEKDCKILHEGKKAFYAGEYRKCKKILKIPTCKNPAKGWKWLNSLATTERWLVKWPSGLVREAGHTKTARNAKNV